MYVAPVVQSIIDERSMTPVFQPVVDLRSSRSSASRHYSFDQVEASSYEWFERARCGRARRRTGAGRGNLLP